MPSPYVRRRQLAAEIRKLRETHGLTADQLGQLVFHSRTKITRLENAQVRPDLAEIMNMLDILEITGSRYDRLLQLAREAAQKGWWDRYGMSMGPRQKLYADLEYSAKTVREYNQTAMPAVLQAPEFITALVALDRCQGRLDYEPERMAEARMQRQQELLRPEGPSYEAIVDEYVIHRLDVPTEAMATQLRHMVNVVSGYDRVNVRVLTHDTRVPGGFLPKSSFYLYTFPQRGDSPLAVLDTVTTDLVLTQRTEVSRYSKMYDRLRKAALSGKDSITFLERVADQLTDRRGS
ncbi:helix-turn-helix domain-containing protein [Actinomadura sp. LD22]|uniref:Helix-turn-helix domain-containing protein n=1 Tax=Actinomadura physcomitrii TaxID=2650748 RepID=A0A6I4M8B4_9ACTN|nr:helix-turn-helix transcriptional regulator [Actinomadura physcomitrii]MWA01943.1 helix-turn-helix domain-containing protein [Actinomadura physcomitrii]